MNNSIKLSSLLKIVAICAITIFVYNQGQLNERQSRKDYFKRLADAQVINNKKKHMETYGQSLFQIVSSKLIDSINTF